MKKCILIFPLILFIFIQISCNPDVGTSDPSDLQKIADAAAKFLDGCPNYFYPPSNKIFWPPDWTNKKSTRGAVAWTPTGLVGNPATVDIKDYYIQRLRNAGVEDQIDYSQYLQTEVAGFPGYELPAPYYYFPDAEYQAGYVCYSLVSRVLADAGATLNWFANSCDNLIFQAELTLFEESQYEYVTPGDIVMYDWEDNGSYDHVGIITNVSGSTDPKNDWAVVSSNGLIEIHNYGAVKRRLGCYGSISSGGDFIYWESEYDNYSFDIYRANID